MLKTKSSPSFPDAPDPPVDVETHNPTSSTITLTWKPPMYDGGAKIMGYILEKQQKGEDKWERCNDFLVPVLSYTIRGLTEGKNYMFRVKAENAAGVSEPSRNTLFVKASDAVGKEKRQKLFTWVRSVVPLFTLFDFLRLFQTLQRFS